MTDGRIPGKWMNEPRFIEMDVHAWCVFTKAIAWSNEAGTDGLIKRRYLSLLHPDGEQPQAFATIAEMGLWKPIDGGYQLIDWNKKAHQGGLGQETAENVRAQKKRKRENQQAYRDRKASEGGPGGPGGGVTGDVTGHVADHVGQDRTGQEQVQEEVHNNDYKNVNYSTGEIFDSSSASSGGEYEASSSSGEVDPIREFMRKHSA